MYIYVRTSKKYMFESKAHIRSNPPRMEGTGFRFGRWLQILNRPAVTALKNVCSGWNKKHEKLAAQDSACGTSSGSSITGTTLFLRTESADWGGCCLNGVATTVLVCDRIRNSTVSRKLNPLLFPNPQKPIFLRTFADVRTANLGKWPNKAVQLPASFAIGSTRLCLPGRSAKPGWSQRYSWNPVVNPW